MRVKNKLTLLFAVMTSTLLLIFAVVVYFSYAKSRQDEYYRLLKQRSTIKANLLFKAGIKADVLQLIYKNSSDSFFPEEVAIYDPDFNLLYHDDITVDKVKETRQMIDEVIRKKELRFSQGSLQEIGFLYKNEGKEYIVTAAAKDHTGERMLKGLRSTLFFAFVASVLIITVVGRFLSSKALKPVSNLVDNVNKITASNLHQTVDEGNGKDELAELAITFNQMLKRLEYSFGAQKLFVYNISHELRTPLAAMIGELDLALSKDRSVEDYKQVIDLSLADAKKINRLINGMLDLAKASYDQSEVSFKELRLDEILLDASRQVMDNNSSFTVPLSFDQEIEDDQYITIKGNEYLLTTAFANLMENGCKFSEKKQCKVRISYSNQKTIISFVDEGIGIPAEDIDNIFTPFYRGSNRQYAEGYGIGLSLCQKIVELHSGSITVNSASNRGTTFTVTLSHL